MSTNINDVLTVIRNEYLNSLFLAHFNILSLGRCCLTFDWAKVTKTTCLTDAQSFEHIQTCDIHVARYVIGFQFLALVFSIK